MSTTRFASSFESHGVLGRLAGIIVSLLSLALAERVCVRVLHKLQQVTYGPRKKEGKAGWPGPTTPPQTQRWGHLQ